MPLLGAHCSTAGGLWSAFDRGEELGCEAIQLFTKSNRQWRARPLAAQEVDKFHQRQAESALPVVAHASYLINLASPNDEIWQKSRDAYLVEMDRCRTLNIPYLVMHPGAHTGSGMAAGISRLAEAINHEHARGDERAMLLLEITAGTGTTIGADMEHFVSVLSQVTRPDRLGFCFDSCHAIGAGWDIVSEAGYERVMQQWDEQIGLDKIHCFHLNDSRFPLGSHRDRHEHIGFGEGGLAPFRHLLNDDRFAGLPMLLETPKDKDMAQDRVNLAVLQALRDNPERPLSQSELEQMWEGVERTPGKDG